jgi:AraC family transcriptional regulator
MDNFELVNQAIAYIEGRLTEPVTTAEVAASIGYSRAHFGRLFLEMTGETLAGYLRKRRLTEAARRLLTTRCSILDLALDYQFESQDAFTRSFKRLFRYSPGAYRRRGRFSSALQRITLRRQPIHRQYDKRDNVLPQQGIIAAQLYTLLIKHPQPSLQARPLNTFYLWYR